MASIRHPKAIPTLTFGVGSSKEFGQQNKVAIINPRKKNNKQLCATTSRSIPNCEKKILDTLFRRDNRGSSFPKRVKDMFEEISRVAVET